MLNKVKSEQLNPSLFGKSKLFASDIKYLYNALDNWRHNVGQKDINNL